MDALVKLAFEINFNGESSWDEVNFVVANIFTWKQEKSDNDHAEPIQKGFTSMHTSMSSENISAEIIEADISKIVDHVVTSQWHDIRVPLSDWQRSQLVATNSELGIGCLLRMWLNVQAKLSSGSYCNATWDGHSCWPPTTAGISVKRQCSEAFAETQPKYAPFLEGNAYRVCQSDGHWLWGNWTNYSECADSYEAYVERTEEEKLLVTQVQHILFFGSILSLICLLSAMTIFLCFKSLWCDRVTIHLHLMAALTLRYVLLYIISETFIFNRTTNYRSVDWVCKTVLLFYLYATVTSVNWMFIQGIYLNGKLTTNVFDKAAPFKLYYTFGWVSPLPLLGFYAVIMESLHPTKCWKGYSEMNEIWIILGPIVVALLANLLLLLNVLRILLTKVHNRGSSSDALSFQRAAKATLILSPILGINNLLFIFNPGGAYNKTYVVLNTLMGSTQGVFVAVVYCYLSNDVRSALRRCYRRYLARRSALRTIQRRRAYCSSTSTGGIIMEQPVNYFTTRALFRAQTISTSLGRTLSSPVQSVNTICQRGNSGWNSYRISTNTPEQGNSSSSSSGNGTLEYGVGSVNDFPTPKLCPSTSLQGELHHQRNVVRRSFFEVADLEAAEVDGISIPMDEFM